MKNVMVYILNKLAALGLIVFIMFIFLLLGTGFDLYEVTESLSSLKFWGYICGYALVTTVLIDLMRYKWREFTFKTSILLHCLAGFIAFFPFMGINPFSLIAGSVGALCALIYALSCNLFKKKKQFVWIALLVFPLLLSIRLMDFTIKKDWIEEKTKSSFSAEFEQFKGKHEIPLSLKKGDNVAIYLSFNQMNDGGYGQHILDNNGEYVGMEEMSEEMDKKAFRFKAGKEGVYKLILTGDNLKGKIDVKWEIY